MDPRNSDLNRRDFLKAGVAVGTGTAVLGGTMFPSAVSADDPSKPAAPATTAGTIPTRAFGKTGRTLPILGMGGSAMIPNFKKAYGVEMLPVEECHTMVRHAFDKGVRYFDTARVYGK